ncbi:uncharacterized protein TM35_000511430 [Trypanosoma theileri]|uniref:Mucin TcMUCII n=1 Tax=Trypanosoma theileri TaxID=67003 RepID=A0A1X0NH07_9TRYP|nr:uncharacterized protein TM35_000511430 [Trypanosoma theileri]ORC84042.1 hypothetical protein TM35_000511430 [Trypanosoma theileri]
MMMMRRVMCVLAVVLCCACGYTMAAATGVVATNQGTKVDESEYEVSLGHLGDFPGTLKSDRDEAARIRNGRRSEGSVPGESESPVGGQSKNAALGAPGPKALESPLEGKENPEGPESKGGPEAETAMATTFGAPTTVPEVGGGTPANGTEAERQNRGTGSVTSSQRKPQGSTVASQSNEEASSNTGDNTTPGDSNTTQQSSTPVVDVTAAPDPEEPNSTIPPSPENTTTEAPTTTPSLVPVTDPQINNITSTVQTKASADSSVSSVWMSTAAPLVIVVVLFTATVY